MTADTLNEYISRADLETFSDREKQIMRRAFMAGRAYEASLFQDVISTIVDQVKKYRAATKDEIQAAKQEDTAL